MEQGAAWQVVPLQKPEQHDEAISGVHDPPFA
jgi:hypothetical protein